ncbi:transketolase family protein [Crenobacter cavernae]|uniref:Transketolase n=1 Tax=Crenobacter cavernae TaxID=2290923 RepID=A0A345Y528_9NEIS|nr:transketolase [Crenobacter cavernae]AXK39030.1 transketolase [Crenobacter cavernae]
MRNAFIDELVTLAEQHANIALVVGDLGYSVVEPFADRFPDRFINAGIAEQNMMGLAAGMASEGYHVFTYSIANFPTFRCAEQIRNDVDYHNLPVTIVTVGGGLAYGNLGYSHHAVQDYGLMRLMPNMTIAAPGDPMEVRACMRYLMKNPGPSYLRLAKAGEPCLHATVPQVEPGKWLEVIPGPAEKTLLTTGASLALAQSWLQQGAYQGHALHSMPLWGMKSKARQTEQLASWNKVVTVEDHIVDGGFGSWLTEASTLGQSQTCIEIRALSDSIFGQVGSQATLNKIGGLG